MKHTEFPGANHTEGNAGRHRCLIRLRKGESGVPLFCVPPWDGSRTYFTVLTKHLKSGFPVYGLEPATDASGQVQARTIDELVTCHMNTLEEAWPTGEIRLLGYSNGACIAWELARQLSNKHRNISFLGNIDDLHPKIKHASQSINRDQFLRRAFLKYPVGMSALFSRIILRHVCLALGITSKPESNRITSEALARKNQVMSGHLPETASLPLTVFKASRPLRSAALLEKDLGWDTCCTTQIRTVKVRGNHDSIVRGRAAVNLAKQISKLLFEL